MVRGSLALFLVLTNSAAHYFANFRERTDPKPISALNDQARFRSLDRYPVTKLIEIFIVQKIASLSKASGIIVSTVNPGLCRTEIGKNTGIILRVIYWSAIRLVGFFSNHPVVGP